MNHGGCCNCFICKLGKSLGLVEDCKCEPKKTKSKITKSKKTKAKKK